MDQVKLCMLFKNLHIKGDPLILFNIWDAGSAKALQEIGAKVIATSSWSVAASHGYDDGEKLSFDWMLANLKRIIAHVNIPVTVDLEGGYGKGQTELQEVITKVIEAGAVGINVEDQIIGTNELYSIEDQCRRIKAARDVAEQMKIPIFINARTDIFLKADLVTHCDNHTQEAIHRASAYAEAGASGFFVPGLKDVHHIEKLCVHSPLPINIMILPDMSSSEKLVELGVARISYGPNPYCLAMNALKEAGRRVLG